MIDIKKVTMYYGPVKAVDSVSFEARQGEVLGLLGPNGAGKTTTMNVIAGHLVPQSGTVAVGGHDVVENPVEARRLTGYLPEREPLYPEMEVAEYLRFVGRARGLGGARLKERMEWVVEACALAPVYRKLLCDLSRGYRQRAGLAQALIHDPPVLILDELTSGLDPLQTSEVRKLVRNLAHGAGQEKCIVFSTHVMQEAQAVSDRVVIINNGQIVAQGGVEEIRMQACREVSALVTVEAPPEEARTAFVAVRGVAGVEVQACAAGEASLRVRCSGQGHLLKEIAQAARSRGWLVKELSPVKPSLEEAFLALVSTHERARAEEVRP